MLAGRVARELEEAGLADRAIVFEAAVAVATADPPPHPLACRSSCSTSRS